MNADLKPIAMELLRVMREACRHDRSAAIALFNLSKENADFLAGSTVADLERLSEYVTPGLCLRLPARQISQGSSLLALLGSEAGVL